MIGDVKIPPAAKARIVDATAVIEGAIAQLGAGYRELMAVRKELLHDAYHAKVAAPRVGPGNGIGISGASEAAGHSHAGTGRFAFFSDIQIRDRVAAALFQAGLAEVLDNATSAKDNSVSSLRELADRFASDEGGST